MDGYGYCSGQRPYGYGGDRRFEIVSGKSNFSNSSNHQSQIYMTRSHSSDPPPIPTTTSSNTRSASSATAPMPWGGFNDPEMKRKKRIAKYKVYTVEGKVKTSLRNGLRWIKNKCSQIIHGY